MEDVVEGIQADVTAADDNVMAWGENAVRHTTVCVERVQVSSTANCNRQVSIIVSCGTFPHLTVMSISETKQLITS